MKTKILIFLIALFIFSFKLHSFANADYSCTVYCSIDNSSASFNTCTIPVPDPYDPSGCTYSCSGTPCAVSTTAPIDTPAPPPSGGTCVNEHGFYSGSAGTFPCCSGLTACASSGTCETSCPGQICSPNAIQYVCSSNHC